MLTPLLNDRKLILAQVSRVTEFCCTIKLSWHTYTLVLNVITIRSLIFITLRLGFSLGRKLIFYSGSIFHVIAGSFCQFTQCNLLLRGYWPR